MGGRNIAVGGAYTGGKTSPVSMKLDQVRIPLQGKVSFGRVKALSMEGFVKTGLTSLLSNYGISVSTHAVGIGKVYLTLGKIVINYEENISFIMFFCAFLIFSCMRKTDNWSNNTYSP